MATFQQTPAGQVATITYGYDSPGNPVISQNLINAVFVTNTTPAQIDASFYVIPQKQIGIQESSDSYTSSRHKVAPKWRRPSKVFGDNDMSLSATGDPFFANVSLLLHHNGVNGSHNGSNDFSKYGHNTVPYTSNEHRTDIFKFGGSSLFLPGIYAQNYLNIYDNGESFDFGTGDFTIEVWIRLTSWDKIRHSLFRSSGTSFTGTAARLVINGDNNPTTAIRRKVCLETVDANPLITSTTSLNLDQWYSLAITRSGDVFRLFLDGVLDSTVTSSVAVNFNGGTAATAIIGEGHNYGSSYWYQGYIDEFRITKGVARYTANYTLQTAEFLNY